MSKTATCGMTGRAARAARMPCRPGGLCSGRERGELLDPGLHGVVDQGRLHEARAAVHDPVADGVDRCGPGPPRMRRAPPGGRDVLGPGSPIRSTMPSALTAPDIGSTTWYLSDDDPAFSTNTDRMPLIGSSCAWIAVIAIVLTMSRTRAPRDRSLIGFARPCSTGPIATAPAERCTAL